MGLSHAEIQSALPEGGLFTGKDWLTSPEPLKISKREGRDRACIFDPELDVNPVPTAAE